jgi:excisionase family DNA binding protein
MPKPELQPLVHTPTEVCQLLRCSRSRLQSLLRNGRLTALKDANSKAFNAPVLILRSEVDRYLAENYRPAKYREPLTPKQHGMAKPPEPEPEPKPAAVKRARRRAAFR